MAGRGGSGRGRAVCRPVAALSGIPAGPQLASALSGMLLPALSGYELVLVLRALYRQGNHDRALLLEAVAEVQRRKDPRFGLHGEDDGEPSGLGADAVGSAEVRAALVFTRKAATALAELARDLTVRLPAVLQAMAQGRLDQPRARCFSKGTELLGQEHARAVVAALLPGAPGMTTGQLAGAIQKAAIELDPEYARRRYEKAMLGRRVHGLIRADGTADLCGLQLAADEVAAICDRLDAIAHHLKACGHPHPLNRIRADIYVGLLDGTYSAMDEERLLAYLLAHMPVPDAQPDANDTDPDPTDPDPTGGEAADSEAAGGNTTDGGTASGGPAAAEAVGESTVDSRDGCDRGVAVRGRGLRLLTCLPTIAGLDQRSSELLGWGWLHADLARRVSSAPHASWWYVLASADGTTVDVGPIRRRPTTPWAPGPAPTYRTVEVWLQLTRAELANLLERPPPGWSALLAEIANRVAHRPGGPPDADPAARFPNAHLRRWIHVRDRHCTFPGCRVAAHRADIDHSTEHAKGGPTIERNLAAACGADHGLHTNGGWSVRQPRAGRVVWTSRLGHDYTTAARLDPARGLPPMPDPTPPVQDHFRHIDDEEWDCEQSLVEVPAPRPRPAPKPQPPPPDRGEPPF